MFELLFFGSLVLIVALVFNYIFVFFKFLDEVYKTKSEFLADLIPLFLLWKGIKIMYNDITEFFGGIYNNLKDE